MAGDGLVHRIVQNLGGEVVEGALIGATDIHARTPADRLKPFENLDILGGIRSLGRTGAEKIVHGLFPFMAGTISARIASGQDGARYAAPDAT
jgi:hypothetical protein